MRGAALLTGVLLAGGAVMATPGAASGGGVGATAAPATGALTTGLTPACRAAVRDMIELLLVEFQPPDRSGVGQTIRTIGQVIKNGCAVGGLQVAVYGSTGGGQFNKLAQTTTDDAGRYSLPVTLQTTTDLVAAVSDATWGAATSQTKKVSVGP